MDDWQCLNKSVRELWGSRVNLSIYRACVHQFQDKYVGLKPPSHLQQGESAFVNCFCPAEDLLSAKFSGQGVTSHNPPHPPLLCVLPLTPPAPCDPFVTPPLLTGQPVHWLCCPSPGASWRQGALGGWRTARSSAAQMNHLRERQRRRVTTVTGHTQIPTHTHTKGKQCEQGTESKSDHRSKIRAPGVSSDLPKEPRPAQSLFKSHFLI